MAYEWQLVAEMENGNNGVWVVGDVCRAIQHTTLVWHKPTEPNSCLSPLIPCTQPTHPLDMTYRHVMKTRADSPHAPSVHCALARAWVDASHWLTAMFKTL